MKKALLKDTFKEIKKTYKRFISILLMAFLGVGFFAGIRATSPDMVDTIDKYFKDQNVYDIQVLSTLGLKDSDIEALKKIENVEEVYGTYSQDAEINIENTQIVSKVLCLEEVNKPVLIEGKLPENIDECAVEEDFLKLTNKQIGDTIEIQIENTTNDDGEEKEYLKQKTVKIVGTVQSPLYISSERGSSNLGAGKINAYIYISKENINVPEIYTEIYIKVKDSNNLTTSTAKYEDLIESVSNDIESIKAERENARYTELVDNATKKVTDAEQELEKEKQDAQTKISEAEQEIADAKNEITKAEQEISTNKEKADKEFANAESQIKTAKNEISKNEETLNSKKQEVQNKLKQAEEQKAKLQSSLNETNSGLQQVETQYKQVVESLKNENLPEEQKQTLEKTKITLEAKKQELQKVKQELDNGIKQIDEQTKKANQELTSAQNQITAAKQEVEKNEASLAQNKKTTYAQINSAQKEVEDAKAELQTGEEELAKNKQEFEEKISEAEEKLIDAKNKIADIENPKWYILDRTGNTGYSGFIQDTESIENIGAVFPIVFFVIATLISLTSMTRMVEEQRQQIGTLKALGYNKMQIASKYIIYATLACIIGGTLGMCVGFVLLPKVIWMMYEMLYTMPEIITNFNFTYATTGLLAASICIIGATAYTAFKDLKYTPAQLIRPKAPKKGKRVLLERVPFIWKRLSFTRKVTVRNLFRYKKRFLMTIIGIAGCTSLIIAGFGLRDTIRSIIPNQYSKVFDYDMQVGLKDGLNDEQIQNLITKLEDKEEITDVFEVYMTSATLVNNENNEDVQIIVPKDSNELQNIINLYDVETEEKVTLSENEICLTDKVAELLNVKQGDTIILRDSDENEKSVKIANIVENYISHYIYMSKNLYESLYDKYETNVLFTKNIDLNEEQENELSKFVIGQSEVGSITLQSTAMGIMDSTMNSLNYVVVILIVSAGLLAFVVLYNLSNVNISERIRELATIKVLGFYDNEVYSYISRETVLLTLIGILLGIFGGYFLTNFIMSTCETDMLRFSKIIEPLSYVYSIGITIIFTLIVNIVTYFALKKINMIESLKSVE